MSKRGEKERAKRQRRWEQQNQTVKDLRAAAPLYKKALQARGHDLLFHDLLDSYSNKFEEVGAAAQQQHPSLRSINEVDEPTYRSADWSKVGYSDLRQARFQFDEDRSDYGLPATDANMCGYAAVFHDTEGRLVTGIMVRQTVKDWWFEHRDLKYVTKIAALLHELGHVRDFEQQINCQIEGDVVKIDIIEAEVFAHLHSLDKLADLHLRQSYVTLVDALQKQSKKSGYLGEVSRKVLERHVQRPLADWQELLKEQPLTEAERNAIGAAVNRAK